MTRLKNNLNFSAKKINPLKLVCAAGYHKFIILDKDIVKKLNIREGDILEQIVSGDGDIILKVKKF